MKPKEITLSGKQLYELEWFCKNVAGTRVEFYEVLDQVNKFKEKIDRLHKTCEIYENFFKEYDGK